MTAPKRGPRPVNHKGLPGRLPTNREVMVVEQRAKGLYSIRASIQARIRIGQHQCLVLQLRRSV